MSGSSAKGDAPGVILLCLTYDSTVSAFQCGGGGGDRGMVQGGMFAFIVTLHPSVRLWSGAGGGVAACQTGGRRHLLWGRKDTDQYVYYFTIIAFIL